VDVVVLAALAEPNRLRIVELLGEAPRPVGEIATSLGLRQPQVTKHLQTLERAGLVRVHPLGQRRVYVLRRSPLRALGRWAAGFADDHPSEGALVRYQEAIDVETRRLATDRSARVVRLRRLVAAPPDRVWAAWTDARLVRRWWSPQHFTVARCTVDPVVGGRLVIVLAEGDGTKHRARGRFTDLTPNERLAFDLSPEDADGRPVLRVSHAVRLVANGERTIVTMRLRAAEFTDDAAAPAAGLRIGWEQTLDRLAALFTS
jgi:uncharacterized protein YndB with AHSA1/START domain/DNA-binding HxlR family transcriptional regulator